MKTEIQERIRALLTPVVTCSGLELDDVRIIGAPTQPIVRVSVDVPLGMFKRKSDDGNPVALAVTSDQLGEVSRNISQALDEDDPIDTPYTLEVSTPGAERELKHINQWVRQVGYMIDIRFKDKSSVVGKLLDVEVSAQSEEGGVIILSVDGKPTKIDLDTIRRAHARVQLTDDHHDEGQEAMDNTLNALGAVEE